MKCVRRCYYAAYPAETVSHSCAQFIHAKPENVFPLLCPLREADWVEGWDPLLVISESGIAESGCIFLTEAGDHQAIWYVSHFESHNSFIEMIKVTPDVTVCKLSIQLAAIDNGTTSTVCYEHTSLVAQGDAFLETFTREYYESFVQNWEAMMNHYLKTGNRLSTE